MELTAAGHAPPPLRKLLAVTLRQHLRRVAARATEHGNKDELIHEIRLATKELRAWLRLLRQPAGRALRRREDRRLCAIARSLAGNRDSLVIRQTLERLARKCDQVATRHSLHRMLIHLGEERPSQPSVPPRVGAALHQLEAIAAELTRHLRTRIPDEALIDALRREYRGTRRLTREVRDEPGAKPWHEWRKRVKALHYQVDWLRDRQPRKLSRLARETWRLQAQLGRHHDLHVTRRRVRRLRIDPINEPCRERTLRLIDRRLARLETKLRGNTKRFLAQTPRKFAESLRGAIGHS